MAAVTTQNPADFANRVQTYFNPKLLAALQYNLVLATYGWTQKYPAIGQTIRFFRPRAANTTGVGALTEGTAPATLTEVGVGYIDVPLTQRGALSKITDLVQAIDLLNTVQMYIKTMGSDSALDLDTVCRNALATGLLNSNGTAGACFERFAGVVPTGNSANDFGTFNAQPVANAKFTRARHLGMVTQLKVSRVPGIGGKYPVILSPAVMMDVRQDTDWVTAATRLNSGNALYKNAEVELDGAVFVPMDNPFLEAGVYGTFNAAGTNYTSFYLGDGAFGTPELSNNKAGGSPMGPKMNILAMPDKSDPLNQQTLIGWKAYYGAKALITNETGNVPHYASIRTKVTFA